MNLLCTVLVLSLAICCTVANQQRPNVIIIVADDLGWNDVSFHGSNQIPTPNIDRLAREGIILNNYYVQQMCTPTRSALLTGRHPIHTGLQHLVILAAQPYGLGLKEKILPQYLNELGYKSHIVGKWHLGFYAKEYTPTFRGFESHFGYWCGAGDYWDHTEKGPFYGEWGLDFRRNMDLVTTAFGQYSTLLFTNESVSIINQHDKTKPLFLYLAHQAVHSGNSYRPLEAPASYVEKMRHINDTDRRTFAAMTVAMDDSVGEVVKTLDKRGMLNNSIIIFTSDNGGPTNYYSRNVASNWPLRGMKNTLWEGGLRVPAFIWSPLLQSRGRVSSQLLHVTDLLPTILTAVRYNGTASSLDGFSQWTALSHNKPSVRKEILHNIEFNGRVYSLRMNDFKLIAPNSDELRRGGWYKPQQYEQDSEVLRFEPQISDSPVKHSNLDYTNLSLESMTEKLSIISKKYSRLNRFNKLVVDCGPKPPDASTNCQVPGPCLYHITSDPCEYRNLAKKEPEVVKMMYSRMLMYNQTAVPPKNVPNDPRGFPINNGWAWRPWVTL